MSNKEKEMTNKVVDASSSLLDTQEGAVMNDSPANTTTDNTATDNSDATDILATNEEEDTPPSNNDNISNNAPYTNDKELLGEPTTTIDGTLQPQPQIEEAPSSPIKQLINKFNQSQQSNNNNDSIQSSAPALALADKVEKEEDVENLTEDEYDQLDNDHDDAMDVVIEEDETEDIEDEGIAKYEVKEEVKDEEGETADNSIAVQTAAVQKVDLHFLDTDNEDHTVANAEEEVIQAAADAELGDTEEEVIKEDFVENANVQEEAVLSPQTETDTIAVVTEGVEDSKTTEIMPVSMEMKSYTNGEAVVTNNTAAASSPVIIEEATPLARSSPTKDNENEITRSEFIRSIFIKRMQESSSNDQLEKQQTNNGVNYCNGNNNIESQPPSPTEMYSAGSQSSEVWYDNNLDNDDQQQQHRRKKYKTVFGGFDKCLVVKIVLGLILVMGIVLGTRGNGSSDNNNVDENGNTSNLSELDSVNVDQETGETSVVSSTTVSPVDQSTTTIDEDEISSPALTLLIPATEVPTSKPTLQPSSFQSTSPSLSVSPTNRPTPRPTLPPTNPFTFYSFIAEDFLRDERSNEASGAELSPDGSHLIVVSDNGKVFFLNLLDYTSGHCMVDLDKNDDIDGMTDFEGVAIDHNDWSPNNMQAYIVHEGNKDEEPYLFKIKYTYDSTLGTCSIDVIDSTSLYWALPCLTDSNGIESLTWKEGTTNPAQFYAGLQDTGKLYEVSSDGTGNGRCHDGGLGIDDLSASSYDGRYLWSFYGETGKIVVIDPERNDCTLATYDMPSEYDKEGLTLDKERGLAYVAVDETGGNNPSLVAVHNFTYPTNLETAACIKSGSSMRVCPALCKEPI